MNVRFCWRCEPPLFFAFKVAGPLLAGLARTHRHTPQHTATQHPRYSGLPQHSHKRQTPIRALRLGIVDCRSVWATAANSLPAHPPAVFHGAQSGGAPGAMASGSCGPWVGRSWGSVPLRVSHTMAGGLRGAMGGAGKSGFRLRGGGSIKPPKTGGGGVREKGSIDRTINQLF